MATTGELRIDRYRWRGGEEAMLRFGPEHGPVAIVAPALFEEANRTRALCASLCRTLASRGIGAVLPDWPGTGESLLPTEDARLLAMREAFEDLADTLGDDGPVHAVGMRGGALIDTFALVDTRWHLAPVTGEAILRDLMRTARASRHGGGAPVDVARWIGDAPVEVAGNRISADMLADLLGAEPFAGGAGNPVRTVRLDSDPRAADRHVAGSPLWRRVEPGNDPAVVETLAGDIADWIATCGG